MSEFEKIIGYTDIVNELERYVDVLKKPEKYFNLGVKLPRGILLSGDPGLGKTLIATCFIKEAGCKTYTIRKMQSDGDFVNIIRDTFEKAKKDDLAVVFLDDMDKYANEDNFHRDADEYVTVQSCIDDCEKGKVFVIATVNNKDCLPESLLRAGRFDRVIEMTLPTGKDSLEIVKYYMRQKKVVDNIDYEEVARLLENHSCAELETVVNEAGIYAGRAGKAYIDQEDIVKAGIRMLFTTPGCSKIKDFKCLEKIAIHEAGHAVVYEMLDPGSVSLVSVWNTYSEAGITKTLRREDYFFSSDQIVKDIIGHLGGKAATEIILGEPDIGCYGDICKVHSLISQYTCDVCASGFGTMAKWEGYEIGNLLEHRERFISSEAERYYQSAKKILIENRAFLDEVIKALTDKKYLLHWDIQNIKNRIMENA